MRAGHQSVAIAAAGHEAVLDRGGCAKLLDQEQADDQKQQRDGDPRKTRGLARGDLVAHGLLEQRTMYVQTTLLLRRIIRSA